MTSARNAKNSCHCFRLAQGIFKYGLLGEKYILRTLGGPDPRTNGEKNVHQLLPVGAPHTSLPSPPLLLAKHAMAFSVQVKFPEFCKSVGKNELEATFKCGCLQEAAVRMQICPKKTFVFPEVLIAWNRLLGKCPTIPASEGSF